VGVYFCEFVDPLIIDYNYPDNILAVGEYRLFGRRKGKVAFCRKIDKLPPQVVVSNRNFIIRRIVSLPDLSFLFLPFCLFSPFPFLFPYFTLPIPIQKN